jgi:anti-sigma factor RsiW
MMALDPFEQRMNLALDGLLSDKELAAFEAELGRFDQRAAWDDLQMIDSLLSHQAMLPPPPDFTAKVMARVIIHETQQRWYPWLISALTIFSLLAVAVIVLPLLLVTQGWLGYILGLPAVIGAVEWFNLLAAGAVSLVEFGFTVLSGWIVYLTQEPTVLAVIISALVVASTWIGLREAMRFSNPVLEAGSMA